MRALVYINKSNKEDINDKAKWLITDYCKNKGYDIAAVYSEDTNRCGMSEETCYMAIGMGVADKIDVVVTVMSLMLGKTKRQTLTNLYNLACFGIKVETVLEDLDEFYEELNENMATGGIREISMEEFFRYLEDAFNAGE